MPARPLWPRVRRRQTRCASLWSLYGTLFLAYGTLFSANARAPQTSRRSALALEHLWRPPNPRSSPEAARAWFRWPARFRLPCERAIASRSQAVASRGCGAICRLAASEALCTRSLGGWGRARSRDRALKFRNPLRPPMPRRPPAQAYGWRAYLRAIPCHQYRRCVPVRSGLLVPLRTSRPLPNRDRC
jgi:hypothetical protein